MPMPSLEYGHSYVADYAHCRSLLRDGSKSFYAASRLLPESVRKPATVLYAFCRIADDGVDHASDSAAALDGLTRRLDQIYRAQPMAHPVDRALTDIVAIHGLPRCLLDALFEGFAWDAAGRHYHSLSDVKAYGVRVAGTVGMMMAWLMGARTDTDLARANDLGVAMQLTNIARDVGEDATAARLYLPRQWMTDACIDPEAWLRHPVMSDGLGDVIKRLLDEADILYQQADAGIAALPRRFRPSIYAARFIYSAIGTRVAASSYDSVSQRAYVPARIKVHWILRSYLAAMGQARSCTAPTMVEAQQLLADVGEARSSRRETKDFDNRVDWVMALFNRQMARESTPATQRPHQPVR